MNDGVRIDDSVPARINAKYSLGNAKLIISRLQPPRGRFFFLCILVVPFSLRLFVIFFSGCYRFEWTCVLLSFSHRHHLHVSISLISLFPRIRVCHHLDLQLVNGSNKNGVLPLIFYLVLCSCLSL